MMRTVLVLTTLMLGCRERVQLDGGTRGEASAALARVLAAAVTEDGWVDYDQVAAHRDDLETYLSWVAEPRPVPRRSNHQRSRWLNIHNALTLWSVLEEGRPDDMSSRTSIFLREDGSWTQGRAFQVDGRWTSIWEIRHERLGGRGMSPLDHAGLYRARRSGPPLRGAPFTPGGVDAELRQHMRTWMEDGDRGAVVEEDHVVLDATFEEYANDFDFWTAGLSPCAFLERRVVDEMKTGLKRLESAGCPVVFRAHDTRVDDASRR